MANSIPRTRRKAWANTIAAKTLKCALFVNLTGYDELTATTYAVLVSGGATEASGTGYTTGGVTLTNVASSNLATNGAKISADPAVWTSASFSFRYAVIYDSSSGSIEAILDAGSSKTVTGGTVTITFDSTYGFIKVI